ncbi:MAG TPA: hypothetical protein VM581_04345 [Magnetospirillaceae bacterium]|nr:hypothetical protein [Magnetospirillaceae bacterium]
MLTTVDEATLFVQSKLAQAAPRSLELHMTSRFLGVGQITWLGVMDREGIDITFFRSTIYVRRGVGVREDRRCSSSPKKRQHDHLLQHLLPGVTSVTMREAWLVAEEDDMYRETAAYQEPHRQKEVPTAPGAQGENIRVCGLDLSGLPFGSTLYVFGPDGTFSTVSLYVTGSERNTLTLKVRSSRNLSDPISLGWFIAAFRDAVE